MTKRFLLSLAIAAVGWIFGPTGSAAGPMTFTSPIGYVNTLGGADIGVTFDDFSSDAFFQNTSLDVGPLTISANGPAHNSLNKVEVFPNTFEIISTGPTPYAALYLRNSASGSTTVTLTFDNPIDAFAGTFREMDRSTVISYTTQAGSQMVTPGISNGFFGFILESGQFISSLMFSTPAEDGFGLDSLLISSAAAAAIEPAPVSEPGTLSLLGIALLFLGFVMRSRQSR